MRDYLISLHITPSPTEEFRGRLYMLTLMRLLVQQARARVWRTQQEALQGFKWKLETRWKQHL